MVTGECNCGAVRFRVDGDLSGVYVCHCSICRRSTGSSGIAVLVVPNERFHWVCGEEHIATWRKPGTDWHTWFCRTCGSRVPGENDPARMFVPAGLIAEGGEALRVIHHIWVGSKAAWDEIGDSGRQHPEEFRGWPAAASAAIDSITRPARRPPEGMARPMTINEFQQWLDRYGQAWVAGDPEAAARLFAADARYHETPFDGPMTGTEAIRRYWTEGAKNAQADVTFRATPLSIEGDTAYARWQATFRRVPSDVFVELDGVLSARFDDAMRCLEFREWWHRRQTPPAQPA